VSVESQLETALGVMLEANAVGYGNVTTGPVTIPEVEGSLRHASVRMLGSRGARLDYGQTEWTDSVAVTCYWRSTIDRSDRLTEWEAFRDALAADQDLDGNVEGLSDAYLVLEAWGEAKDGAYVVMAAEIETRRIE